MLLRLKFLLVWLIALALPVQALASATMLHCGPSHQRMHALQMGVEQQAAAHHHHAQHQAASEPHRDKGQSAPLADLGKYKCSACAACGSGCALPSCMLVIATPEFGATVFVAVVPAVEAFAVDGPDRPPRRLRV
ncbi:MAG: hypothetical protein ABL916_19030 [Burkholderiaceae bacterium]